MTPTEKVLWLILNQVEEWNDNPKLEYPLENIEQLFSNNENDMIHDAINEIRCTGIRTDIPCESSRHYESYSVGTQLPDSSWVGWTYWYGGGKHGEPEAIDWISGAYDLTCTTEEKLVTILSFEKEN